jgi:hypothetical protein
VSVSSTWLRRWPLPVSEARSLRTNGSGCCNATDTHARTDGRARSRCEWGLPGCLAGCGGASNTGPTFSVVLPFINSP